MLGGAGVGFICCRIEGKRDQLGKRNIQVGVCVVTGEISMYHIQRVFARRGCGEILRLGWVGMVVRSGVR